MTELIDEYKAVFRTHPAGVALIAAQTPDGPVGLTASSVASLGVDPLALSFSVTRSGGSAGGILGADTFVVHLLGEEHAATADAFARSGAPRFTPEQGWSELPTGEPHLAGAPAAMRARALHVVPVGASRLVVAEVLDIVRGPESGPLLYRDRRFLSLARDAAEVGIPVLDRAG